MSSLIDLAHAFDAVVLDQWGVLHDGTSPYPGAVDCVLALAGSGVRLGVLSNSGKRAALNAARIEDIGFPANAFDVVMTSGEAAWRDIRSGKIAERRFLPIERTPGDAADFLDGLDVEITDDPASAESVLLMGTPDDAPKDTFEKTLSEARQRNVPVICTNPDRASPRADGRTVSSPGALAHAYRDQGGDVRFYGKPHPHVFRSLETALGVSPERILIVGDSLEHDIAGGAGAGWGTAFVRGGLHAGAFGEADIVETISHLAKRHGAPMPDYSLHFIGGPG